MISVKNVGKLEPGTILYRIDRDVDEMKILTTPPVQRRTAHRVYFEGLNRATSWSTWRGKTVVENDYFLTEREAFIESIHQLRLHQFDAEDRAKELSDLLNLAEAAAKKEGWIDG